MDGYRHIVVFSAPIQVPREVIIEQLEEWMNIDEEPIEGVSVSQITIERTMDKIIPTSHPYGD